MKYPLSPNPIFYTLQGEGHLRGFPAVFVRLAGCSVGCHACDTDYTVDTRVDVEDIAYQAKLASPAGWRDRWVVITGGEPTDHDLRPLVRVLKSHGFSTVLNTAGHRRFVPPVDWLSVSPHDPGKWVQLYGNEVKIVPGLNGFKIEEFLEAHPDSETDFMYRYVQPLWRDGQEDPDSLRECKKFLRTHPNWALSRQDHKYWNVS